MLAGAAAAVLWPAAALAQSAGQPDPGVQSPLTRDLRGQVLNDTGLPTPKTSEKKTPQHLDGLKPGELYMEADQLSRDDKAGTTTAEGHVEIRYEDQTLRADRVVYKEPPPDAPKARGKDAPAQGVIRAYGHVQIIKDDGTVEYANQITLDDKLQAAVATGFSLQMHDQKANQDVRVSSDTAVRRSEDIQELNKAIYTACPICVGDKPKSPTWSLHADRVVQDQVHHVIYYRHVWIHILGVPAIYLPVFWHADPTADRESGLLVPRVGSNSRLGFFYEQPYLWVISPSADLEISPRVMTNANPFLNLRYREAFNAGVLDLRLGYTHEADLDPKGNRIGENTNRSYILSRGSFQVSDNWIAGFTAERTSDPLLFDKYDIPRVYQARGPYVADDHRLISQAYALRQDDNSYFSVAAFSVQGLRPGDNDRTFPVVAPIIEGRYEDPNDVLGGRLRFTGSEVTLSRDQSPDVLTVRAPGMNSTRVSTGFDWNRIYTSTGGLRFAPFVQGRVDNFYITDILTQLGQTTPTSLSTFSKTETRAVGVVGADISYPLYRRVGDSTVILEPLAQIDISPKAQQVVIGHNPTTGKPIYFDEDSIALEFDETTLFQPNKFPGYDLYEDGTRLNLGGRATVLWDDGRRASLLVGRSFRDGSNNAFAPGSGLATANSDWIVAVDAAPMKELSFFGRARLDSETFAVHRLEAGANVNFTWGNGYVRYLTDDQGVNGTPLKNLDLGADLNLTKHWGLSAYGNRDLLQHAWVVRDVGVFYKDECIRVDVYYRHEDVIIGRLGATDQLSIRLTLATLGAPFYGH
ncbi:MAG: LPS-assembly protein LptD [Proteobacteria bacterium]|nr:LPS-assembly protein LptD [Pseudomonadota bacterium]